jgi:aspartyl-tRNA synthetase
LGLKVELPLLTMSYHDAMHYYGSDKPDLRFGLKLQEVKSVFAKSNFAVFQTALGYPDGVIKAIVLENGAVMTRKETDELTEVAKKNGAKGLVVLKYQNNALEGSVVKFLSPEEITGLCEVLSLKNGDLILITADKYEKACNALGSVRLALRDKLNLAKKDDFKYLWVVDFPLFEYNEEENRFVAKHHPFTRPKEEELHLLKSDPGKVHACAYDLVLNGFEVAGGSMRIYDQEVQKTMFEIIGFTKEQIESRFGFFIDAFQYGTPPHGGIAFGLDRFAMVLTQSDSIRDVIAFPKNASARCPVTDAPTPVDQKQLDELHLTLK